MIKAVIFDLYGTLLELPQDSKPFWKLAQSSSVIRQGDAIRIALTKHCPTLSVYVSLLNIDSDCNLSLLEKDLHDDLQQVRLYPEAIRTLKSLKAAGIKTAVISNLATPYKTPFSTHRLSTYFDEVVFSCDCNLMKPDPAIYKIALQNLGSSPQETIMVGDSLKSDVKGPSKLGIACYHLKRSKKINDPQSEFSTLESILKVVS